MFTTYDELAARGFSQPTTDIQARRSQCGGLNLVPGLIDLDFADVKTIMSGMGMAMMGTGMGEGETRAVDAARRAISSPLLEGACVNGARGVIINVTGGPDLSLMEVSDASTMPAPDWRARCQRHFKEQ